jgi:trehalose 6-phosphate synthase
LNSENVTPLEATRSPGRLLVVSNRLPVIFHKDNNNEGRWSTKAGSGGLVSALMPVLRDRGGVWVGWPGVDDDDSTLATCLEDMSDDVGYGLEGVFLSHSEVKGFYEGFSNEIIWPLFHDLPVDCYFDPEHWNAYRKVNRKFAARIAEIAQPNDLVWVHDYHLIGVAAGLRRHGMSNPIGFFLHIPFPPPDIFLKLPWRDEILGGMLEYDLVGFQTLRDLRNFQRCLQVLYDVKVEGAGQVKSLTATPRDKDGVGGQTKRLRVGSFPISIDFAHYENLAKSEATKSRLDKLAAAVGERQIILSVDRLDYTKGLLAKLRGFHRFLERYPDMHEKVELSLHVVPSRETIKEYRKLKTELEQLVSAINGRWSRPGWIPIHFFYHSMEPSELAAYYRRADIMFVSPLKDGMNLVAKEYCASHPDDDGVLVLSEFAGAAAELQKGALLINPYDLERTAERLYEAATLDAGEVHRRMKKLRRKIRRQDIYHWVDSFLNAIAGRALADFPKIEDYVPGPPPARRAGEG